MAKDRTGIGNLGESWSNEADFVSRGLTFIASQRRFHTSSQCLVNRSKRQLLNPWKAYSGLYHFLPLGLRVQEKLERLLDKHMVKLGIAIYLHHLENLLITLL